MSADTTERQTLADSHDLRCAVMRGSGINSDPDDCTCRDEQGHIPRRAPRRTRRSAMTELDHDTAATLAKLRDVNEQIKQLTEDAETYKAQLRERLGSGAYTVGGEVALSITPTRRFDADLAEKTLPVEWRAACQRFVVDSTLAKKVLPPALYQACSVESSKATVKLP